MKGKYVEPSGYFTAEMMRKLKKGKSETKTSEKKETKTKSKK